LAEAYPSIVRKDPVASWQKRAATLRAEKNPHRALQQYSSFMSETDGLREMLSQSAEAAEAEIDAAIDRMRGK